MASFFYCLFFADKIIKNRSQYGQKDYGNNPQYFFLCILIAPYNVENYYNIYNQDNDRNEASHSKVLKSTNLIPKS